MAKGKVKGAEIARHLVGTGKNQFVINLSDVYASISKITGVSKLTGDIPEGAFSLDYDAAVENGLALKVTISYKKTGATKVSESNIMVATEKLSTALTELVGENFNGGKIVSARFRKRRILR